jgi:oxazoline/thiazoline synthase
MFNKPKFKCNFHIEILEPKTIYLLSEQGHFVLNGHLYVLLAPLLDGSHTVDKIVSKLKTRVSVAAIYYALIDLESKGYITDANESLPSEIEALCNTLGVNTKLAIQRLQETTVSVTSFGEVQTEPFISVLQSLNIRVSQEGQFTVVLTDDYLQLGLDAFNRKAVRSQHPWMLVKPVGSVIWIGPIFRFGETGCWECLSQRLRGNREVETAIQQQKGISTPFPTSRPLLPFNFQIGLNLAATETAKWIVRGEKEQLEGKLTTLDLVTLDLQHHVLVRRPQCSVCGNPAAIKQKPLELISRKKQFTLDGGHRCCSPEQTLKQYEHHISPITGAVSTLQQTSNNNDSLIYVYAATHKSLGNPDTVDRLRQILRQRSAGKGKTDLQSKASAFCEAIERYSGIYTGDEIRVKGTYYQLKETAIHPNICMQFSANQYRNRQVWNQQHSQYQLVPEPFDEEQEIEWTPVWSLTKQTFKYLPTAYCYYNFPYSEDYRFCRVNSNGCAAGNTLEEAILQGFMELVERDSIAIWWYNRVKRPNVDLASFDEPYLPAIKAHYKNLQRELWVLDITTDLNIPVFVALSRRTDQAAEEIMIGFGAHFDPKIAVLRAVTEMNQMFVNTANHNGKVPSSDSELQTWLTTATLNNQPYLVPEEKTASKRYDDYPLRWSDDLCEDVLTCVEIAAQQGMETLVLDQTRPDIGLSVVRVIVPELRHFWARFAPGRLYDVPVKLGWLPAPLTEDQLNPIPMFL